MITQNTKETPTWGISKGVITTLITVLIVSLVTSTFRNVIWMTRADTRIETLEKRVSDLDHILVNIATIQANQGYNRKALERIELSLRKQ